MSKSYKSRAPSSENISIRDDCCIGSPRWWFMVLLVLIVLISATSFSFDFSIDNEYMKFGVNYSDAKNSWFRCYEKVESFLCCDGTTNLSNSLDKEVQTSAASCQTDVFEDNETCNNNQYQETNSDLDAIAIPVS